MAFADYDAYKAAVANPRFRLPFNYAQIGSGSSAWQSLFTVNGGASPGTSRQCGRDTVGSLGAGLMASLSNPLFVTQTYVGNRYISSSVSQLRVLIDRLVDTAGLSGTVTTAQTTNLPTPALTRYTSGLGVMAALQVYSSLGATPQTATISYTNQAGTAARTSKAIEVPASAGAGRLMVASLQDGDTGVRSVEEVLLSGSTGTAGNFGVTLFKPVMTLPLLMSNQTVPEFLAGRLPPLSDDACLDMVVYGVFPMFGGHIDIAEVA